MITKYYEEIAFRHIEKAFAVLIALNNIKRRAILRLLHERQEMTVTEIYIATRAPQSETSTHLAALRNVGIVDTKRDGKYRYYFINERHLSLALGAITTLAALEPHSIFK